MKKISGPYLPAENPLPDPKFIISIESFTVTHGQMVRVPNFYYQASGNGSTPGGHLNQLLSCPIGAL